MYMRLTWKRQALINEFTFSSVTPKVKFKNLDHGQRCNWENLWPHGSQHTRLPCPPLSPRVCSNPCPLNQWCYLTISSSAICFSFCLQSLPASESFPMISSSHQVAQSTGASASASVLPMSIQGWFPLGLTGLTSVLSTGLSRVFSSTTIWKCQFSCAYLFLWSNSHIHTQLLEKS